MSNFIDHIIIDNFKSLKHCELTGCKQINLFIGRPNVGKSNIIEALSMFAIPYLSQNTSKKLSNIIRLENESELFYNGSIEKDAHITTNKAVCKLGYNPKGGLKIDLDFFGNSYLYTVDEKLNVRGGFNNKYFEPPFKRYSYKIDVSYKKGHAKYLIPPFGYNLLSILEQYNDLRSQVVRLFREYGLEVVFDKSSQTIKIIQSEDSTGIFLIPYNSIADTLQRIIFYKSAIASNNDSILLFEEPEAHSFPPYMTHLTQEMIYKNDNQYFIATHSPFILNDLLENSRENLAVFIVHYEDHETKVKQLNQADLHEIFQSGVDLFTNNESFV